MSRFNLTLVNFTLLQSLFMQFRSQSFNLNVSLNPVFVFSPEMKVSHASNGDIYQGTKQFLEMVVVCVSTGL